MSTISASTTSTTAYKVTADTTGTLVLQTGATPTTAVTIDSSQNVGVGASTMVEKLNVSASGITSGINLTNTGTSGRSYSIFSTSTGASTVGSLGFYDATAAAYRMVIDSSGRLLVGTTSATIGGVTCAVALDATTVNSGFGLGINGNASNTQVARFAYAGTAVGSISITGSTTAYNTSSDYRLKENVQPMTGALEKVAALKPVTYTWKVDGSNGEGFIAHELAEVCPNAVTGEKDAVDADGNPQYQGIDVSFLVGTLTAAIQELKAELDAAKADIATLKGAA